MHTATQLKPSSFQYLIGGENADLTGLFPRWTPDDRFGILIDRPPGALGASLLIQAAIAAFYDVRPERRGEAPAYPEIYALHVGGPFGDHSAFDFWPPRKEVVIPPRNPVDILTAVNTHAITRLAVPDVSVGDVAGLEEGPSRGSSLPASVPGRRVPTAPYARRASGGCRWTRHWRVSRDWPDPARGVLPPRRGAYAPGVPDRTAPRPAARGAGPGVPWAPVSSSRTWRPTWPIPSSCAGVDRLCRRPAVRSGAAYLRPPACLGVRA